MTTTSPVIDLESSFLTLVVWLAIELSLLYLLGGKIEVWLREALDKFVTRSRCVLSLEKNWLTVRGSVDEFGSLARSLFLKSARTS